MKENGELGKERFRELYGILKKAFYQIYGSEIQIKYYMFFLLCLKGYSKVGGRMVLFPFNSVHAGDRVLVYGAGGFGRVVREYVKDSDEIYLCGWTDKRADNYIEQGMCLDRYEAAFAKNYDVIVIAILNEGICNEVREELVNRGVPSTKIDYVRKEVIQCTELPHWLVSARN